MIFSRVQLVLQISSRRAQRARPCKLTRQVTPLGHLSATENAAAVDRRSLRPQFPNPKLTELAKASQRVWEMELTADCPAPEVAAGQSVT